MRRSRSIPLALSLAAATLALAAPAASATFHLMLVREVYPGSATYPDSEYIELQMYATGQNFVAGHVLNTYSATGALVQSNAFAANVANGASQSTIVMATPAAEAQFGMVADGTLSPSGQLDPAGGAVCWESIDCVSWGSFSGSLPSPAGAPAAPGGIPDGMALRRTIAPGCATLLEPTDDSDSGADFFDAFPAPRPNSTAPSEHPCTAQVAPGAGPEPGTGPAASAPQTRIVHGPGRFTDDRTPTFRFRSNQPAASFQCRLDGGRFGSCRSPFVARRLSYGCHTFGVRARVGPAVDPSAASYRFRVVRPGGRHRALCRRGPRRQRLA